MDVRIQLAIVHFFKDVAFLIAASLVFVDAFSHLIPLTQFGVEALGIFGSYYGVHRGTSTLTDKMLSSNTKP